MDICIVNQAGWTPADMAITKSSLSDYLSRLTRWDFGSLNLTDKESDSSVNIYITSSPRGSGAGFHGVDHRGIPAAWILPGTQANRYGTYRRARYWRGKCWAIETMRLGPVGVICHEVAELLGDPQIKTLSMPDRLSRTWLREICDPVEGSMYMRTIAGKNVVFPDTLLPSFYDINALPPYDLNGAVKSPFTKLPTGRAYYVDSTGKIIKI